MNVKMREELVLLTGSLTTDDDYLVYLLIKDTSFGKELLNRSINSDRTLALKDEVKAVTFLDLLGG